MEEKSMIRIDLLNSNTKKISKDKIKSNNIIEIIYFKKFFEPVRKSV